MRLNLIDSKEMYILYHVQMPGRLVAFENVDKVRTELHTRYELHRSDRNQN